MSITTRISPDHKLLILVQYNVLRATLTSMAMLGMLHLVPAECGMAAALAADSLFPVPSSLPPCFEPTRLQRATDHGYWIDIIPLPAIRDNILRNMDSVSQAELCYDLVGGLYHGVDEVRSRGLVVWSDPWQAEGWEVSEGFVAKWGFLLKGCRDLLQASNTWRRLRGEEPMVFEV